MRRWWRMWRALRLDKPTRILRCLLVRVLRPSSWVSIATILFAIVSLRLSGVRRWRLLGRGDDWGLVASPGLLLLWLLVVSLLLLLPGRGRWCALGLWNFVGQLFARTMDLDVSLSLWQWLGEGQEARRVGWENGDGC